MAVISNLFEIMGVIPMPKHMLLFISTSLNKHPFWEQVRSAWLHVFLVSWPDRFGEA
jgi:hypothetical protein